MQAVQGQKSQKKGRCAIPLTTGYSKTHPFNHTLYYSLGTTTDLTSTTSPYTQIGDVKKMKIGGVEFNEVDITHLASSNAFKESMAGWGKQKPISYFIHFHEDNFESILESTNIAYGRGTATFAMIGPNPTQPTTRAWVYYHTAWVKDMDVPEIDTDSDDPLGLNVELQPTGRSNFSTVTT